MAHFEELDVLINQSISMLLNNPQLCKLLYYYPNKVNLQYDPLSQPSLQNPKILLLDKIFPMPKAPDAETEQVCFIDVNVSGEPMKVNTGFYTIHLIFDIICHLDCWLIRGGFRPLKVVSEIDKMFNNQLLPQLPIANKPQILPLRTKNYSHKFFGYELVYEMQVNSNVECQ